MTNVQLWLAIGIPTVLILIGILLQRDGVIRIENRLTAIEGDLRRFYQLIGEHTGQIDALKNK